MMGPAATERDHVESMIAKDGVHEWQVCDVILGLILFDCRDATESAEVSNGLVKVLIEFLPENPSEFFTVVAGARFKIFVAVEDVKDLEFHAGQAAGHKELLHAYPFKMVFFSVWGEAGWDLADAGCTICVSVSCPVGNFPDTVRVI